MGSSTLGIWGDWLKEWDAMKSLAKVVEISKKEFSMITTCISTNLSDWLGFDSWPYDVSFSCVVKTQRRRSKKNYKTELTKISYNNQVLCKYRVDLQRAMLTLIAELTSSNLGLKGVLNKRK